MRRLSKALTPSDAFVGARGRVGRVRPCRASWSFVVLACVLACAAAGCRRIQEKINVRPRALRDVPSSRLAFRLEPDVSESVLPSAIKNEAPNESPPLVKADFETRRKDEALLRAVVSPDEQRALALYDPGGLPPDEFRIDLYSADGMFIRNLLPPDLSGVTPAAVRWSPDGQWIAFIGRKSERPQPSPSPLEESATAPPAANSNGSTTPIASPTVAPLIAPVAVFNTEQIYLCDRDGFNLRPLTTRDGLIYFHLAWSPDGHALAALACKESELAERINENKPLAGRPRIIEKDGRERLLDDQLMDALPVWSPDSSKVATAAGTDVSIYDAAGTPPTGARLPLRDTLLAASIAYDAQTPQNVPAKANVGGKKQTPAGGHQATLTTPADSMPLSFNPIVRLEWVQPETLLVQTGFIRIYQNNETVTRYLRWHVLHLSPQAALLS